MKRSQIRLILGQHLEELLQVMSGQVAGQKRHVQDFEPSSYASTDLGQAQKSMSRGMDVGVALVGIAGKAEIQLLQL